MKKIIKKLLNKIFSIFPLKNIIIMESNPDFADNSKLVFDELIKDGVNKKYKIIWFVSESKLFKNKKVKNVKFIKVKSKYNLFIKIRKFVILNMAKIICDSNNFIPKVREEQIRIHLAHGTPLKNATKYNQSIGNVDYILELSNFFKEANSISYKLDKNKFIDLGFPRNDELLEKLDRNIYLPELTNKKIIIWLPTYRKHNYNNDYSDSSLKFGIPCFENEEDFEKINNILKQLNIIILLKLHPAQDKSILNHFEKENIRIITDEQLLEKKINLYQLLSMSDGLITDYSSVYYDYLLTNKPIGLAISDINEYSEKVGFVYDYYNTIKGHYIYELNELINFIENISNNNDIYYEQRKKVLEKYHQYTDGKSTERVVKYIEKYL
ncbi:MAG: CDP-glycerol glycerophosphotransferase family protein [Candidatus Scatovivens sp.]